MLAEEEGELVCLLQLSLCRF